MADRADLLSLSEMITLRCAQPSDISTLAALYRQSVLATAPQACTPAQTATWAAFASDLAQFQRFILGVTTYVAIEANAIETDGIEL